MVAWTITHTRVRSAYKCMFCGADVGSIANQTEYYSMDPAIISTPWMGRRSLKRRASGVMGWMLIIGRLCLPHAFDSSRSE